MKKAMRKMIPAVIMLLISAMLVGTSTYAWFSMNKTVTVTGMAVKAKGTTYLKVASGNADDSGYQNSLNQSVKGNLRPVSTVSAANDGFYYTMPSNVKGDGDAVSDTYVLYAEDTATSNTYAKKDNYDDDFNAAFDITSPTFTEDTGTVIYGYVDYTIYLKAFNAGDAATKVIMSKCNILYNGAPITTEKAWRVAVFAQEVNAGAEPSTLGSLVSILGMSGSDYFTAGNKAVSATDAAPSTAVSNYGTAVVIDNELAASDTQRYKVVVRLWLEGEDKTCTSDLFAGLDQNFTLDLDFTLGTTGVNLLNSATVTASNAGVATLSVGNAGGTSGKEDYNATYQWKNEDGTSATGTGNDTASFTGGTNGNKYYCEVTLGSGAVYKSNVITYSNT